MSDFNKLINWIAVVVIAAGVIIAIANLRGCGKQATLNEVTIKTQTSEAREIERIDEINAEHDRLSNNIIHNRLQSDCRDCDEPDIRAGGVSDYPDQQTRQTDARHSTADRSPQYDIPQPQSENYPALIPTAPYLNPPCAMQYGFDEDGAITRIKVCE